VAHEEGRVSFHPQPKPLPKALEKRQARREAERDDRKIKAVIKARDHYACRCCGAKEGLDVHERKTRAVAGSCQKRTA
jgi:hypothetical protein